MADKILKVKDSIDLGKLLEGFEDRGKVYYLENPLGAFIHVNKQTRIISEYGYIGLVIDWCKDGLIEEWIC